MADSNFYSNGTGGIWQADKNTWERNEGHFPEHDDFLFEGKENEIDRDDISYGTDGTIGERDSGQGDCW